MTKMSGSVLIHCCCAHCTAYTLEYWRQQGYEATVFWYNPNIHPYLEHKSRLSAIKSLSQTLKFPLVISDGYDIAEYFRRVVGHEAERCRFCFDLRLSETAKKARELGFTTFTSTLLISPHQKHELIKGVGDKVARNTEIEFLYADLRKRYSDSRHITKPLDLYRQQYCGCLYSEWERYSESGT